jgi:hypothetical protein
VWSRRVIVDINNAPATLHNRLRSRFATTKLGTTVSYRARFHAARTVSVDSTIWPHQEAVGARRVADFVGEGLDATSLLAGV